MVMKVNHDMVKLILSYKRENQGHYRIHSDKDEGKLGKYMYIIAEYQHFTFQVIYAKKLSDFSSNMVEGV